MTFGSLFAGIGGLDLGLERAGMTCRWQVEIDPYCLKVLAKHWPNVKRYEDIRKLTGDELEPVDLICGGFPCQDLSQAGKRAGIEGTRSGLWFEFSRLVGRLRPDWILAENVPGLLVYDGMRRIIGELSRCGYVGFWRCLRASEFGAAHIRKRVFILAYRESRGLGELRKPPQRNGLANRSSAELAHSEYPRRGILRETHHTNRDHASGDHVDRRDSDVDYAAGASGWREFKPRTTGQRGTGPERADGTLDHTQFPRLEIGDRKREQPLRQGTESIAPGLPAFAPGPADSRWPTILTVRPDLAPALESPIRGVADELPDWMDRAMSNRTKRLGRLGNAVVPQVAEWIGRKILEHDDGTH